jgi:hypothetical protein
MLQRDDDHAREPVRHPRVVDLGAGREAERRRQREMALAVENRILHGGPVVVARQQHRGAEVDGAAPELREQRTPNLEALHELGVGRDLDRQDDLVGRQPDRLGGRPDLHPPRLAIEIAGRGVPVPASLLVVVHPDGMAVGARELRVDVDGTLHPVVPGGRSFIEATGVPRSFASSTAARPGGSISTSRQKKGVPVRPICRRGSRSLSRATIR